VTSSLAQLLIREAGLEMPEDPAAVARLERQLVDGLAAARAAWPTLDVPVAQFLACVAARLPGDLDPDVGSRLERMHLTDLYLACACADGDPRGLELFERRYLDVVDAALATMKTGGEAVQEVKQIVRRLLLVADDSPPLITEYGGQDDLRGWVRESAARAALRLLRGNRREVPLDIDALERALPPGADAQLEYIKTVYQGEFRAAFRVALDRLSERERNVLAQQFGDRLTLDQIAAHHHVHRGTVARWLGAARARLLRGTRTALRSRLGVQVAELDGIMRLIESRLDVTLSPLLRSSADPE
jgi:RNA polymerase sigma-70 factor, ECF subfamily